MDAGRADASARGSRERSVRVLRRSRVKVTLAPVKVHR